MAVMGVIALALIFYYLQFPAEIPPKEPLVATEKSIYIVLSPHLDDAVLSLGGFISQDPSRIVVATFFAGSPHTPIITDWDTISGFSDSAEAHQSRILENKMALRGAEIINYNYLDYQYETGRNNSSLETKITDDILKLISQYKDYEVSVFGPVIFPGDLTHPDHKVVHDAFYKIIRSNPNKSVTFYLYEDIPYAPASKSKGGMSLEKFLKSLYSENVFTLTIIPLTQEFLVEKINRIKLYPSQIKSLSYSQRPLLEVVQEYTKTRCISEELFACEVVYHVGD